MSAVDLVDLLACHGAGMTAQEAADHLGFDRSTIYHIGSELGITWRSPAADRHARIIADREAGMTYTDLGKKHGMTTTGARAVIVNHAPHLAYRKHVDDRAQRARDLLAQGMTQREVAEVIGVSQHAIYRYARQGRA